MSLAFVGRVLAQSLVAEFAVPGTALPVRDSQNFGWLCNTFRGATNLVKSSGHVEGNENKNNTLIIIMTTQPIPTPHDTLTPSSLFLAPFLL